MVKQKFNFMFCVIFIVLAITSSGFAIYVTDTETSGYDIFWSDDVALVDIFLSLKGDYGLTIADVGSGSAAFRYKLEISFDDLADKVMLANNNRILCSLYKNTDAGYWVGYVLDIDRSLWDGGERITGTLSNPDGYVYVAEIDTSGEDSVELLTSILTVLYQLENLAVSQDQSLIDIVHPINGYLVAMQNSLASINTSTTQFIIPYLQTISYSLNNSGSSVAMYLDSINTKLDTLITNQGSSVGGSSVDLTGIATKLETLISNQSAMLELLQAEGAFITDISGIEDALVLLSTDLGTMTSNQSDILGNLETLISNQSDILELLGEESTFYTDGYGILGNLETLISNQSSALANQQAVSTTLSEIANALSYDGKTIANRIYALNTNLVAGMRTLYEYQESTIANQQALGGSLTTMIGDLTSVKDLLSEIAATLHMPESGLSFSASISSMESNLDRLRNALCGGGAEAGVLRDLESGISRLDDSLNDIQHDISDFRGTASEHQQDINRLLTDGVIVGLTAVSDNQTAINELLVDIAATLHMPESGLSFSASISSIESNLDRLRNALCGGGAEAGVLRDLESGISRLDDSLDEIQHDISDFRGTASEHQQDINRLLTDATDKLGTLIENQNTALTNQQEVNTTLSNIEGALFDDGKSIYSRLNLINNNLVSGMKTVFSNQEALIALLEDNGTSGVDFSGLLDKQQELIDLIKDLNVTTVENIENITIDVTNEAYEIFYIRDDEGNELNLGEFTGDVLSIGGRLLNFFFRAAFDIALDSVDAAIDDATDFYIDNTVVLEGDSLWD